ncbi:MAG: ATP-binding protein [Coriobacteriales bacterium]|jgi:predicted AAA+ superfamily ATPase|nr:ATP-binding protein [Coriobacteriales bacterium]
MIERKEYMERLIGFRDRNVIKIITGVRRSGKSTLLELFREYLLRHGVDGDHIIFINFEDYANRALKDSDALHAHVLERAAKDGKTYVFLDEIQAVGDFQAVVDSLFLRKNLDLYLTGSNAHLLSGDLATMLSGRYVEIEMLPLSFAEFLTVNGGKGDLQASYRLYLETSSFPGALDFEGNRARIIDYLRGIYDTVVLNDVVARRRITDVMMLESLISFAYDNVGSLLSTKRISDYMSSSSRRIDVKTVERYLGALVDSFILYRAKRYDVRGKQYLKTLEKYYAVDIGLRQVLLGSAGSDVGHILENVVYLELLRRGYQVYVGKLGELEVDFVAKGATGIVYLQVAASVRDPKTLERELAPLKKIKDHYPKLLLTLDEDPNGDFDGIRRMNALEWLAGSS